MDANDEISLRNRVGRLALDWGQERHGPFTGDQPESYAPLIEAAEVVADEARLTVARWVSAGRRGGLSWADIGGIIGVSRQAAQQRFGGDDRCEERADAITVKLGATAFNEIAMLKREGKAGRELIDTGALRLFFRQTDHIWTYRRTVGEMVRREQEKGGWTPVSNWFVFHYYKRRA